METTVGFRVWDTMMTVGQNGVILISTRSRSEVSVGATNCYAPGAPSSHFIQLGDFQLHTSLLGSFSCCGSLVACQAV